MKNTGNHLVAPRISYFFAGFIGSKAGAPLPWQGRSTQEAVGRPRKPRRGPLGPMHRPLTGPVLTRK